MSRDGISLVEHGDQKDFDQSFENEHYPSTTSSNSAPPDRLVPNPHTLVHVVTENDMYDINIEDENIGEIERERIETIAKAPSKTSAIANLVNYIIGAGILGLPYVLAQCGWALGIFLLVLGASATLVSLSLLVRSSHNTGAFSYERLAFASGGAIASSILKVFIIIDSLGPLSAYMLIMGDSFHDFIASYSSSHTAATNRQFLTFVCLVVFVIPLCFVQKISKLGFTSVLSLIPLVYLIMLQIVYLGIHGLADSSFFSAGPEKATGFFVSLPIVTFSYGCQQALFPIYSEIHESGGNKAQIHFIVRVAVLLATSAYLSCALLGYLSFGTAITGSILRTYPKSVENDILLFSMMISIALSYPVVVYPCRESVDRLLFPHKPLTYSRFVIQNICIVLIAYGISSLFPSFNTLLGVFGAVTSTTISYLLPSFFYLRTAKTSLRKDWRNWVAIALGGLGGVFGLTSFIVVIRETVRTGL